MSPYIVRLAYISEFLLATLAILELWAQVGGQGHLDLMPWYTKLGLTLALAMVTVGGTVSAVAHERAWNAKTITCLILGLVIATGMGFTSYYYHLHEGDDVDSSEDDGVAKIFYDRPSGAAALKHERR